MRKRLSITALVFVYGCQQNVVVPTTKQLLTNRQLLSDWQAECDTGEYSQLPADQKTKMCSTTENAVISAAEIQAGKDSQNFYDANIKRK